MANGDGITALHPEESEAKITFTFDLQTVTLILSALGLATNVIHSHAMLTKAIDAYNTIYGDEDDEQPGNDGSDADDTQHGV